MLVKTALRDFDQSDFEVKDWTAIIALEMMIVRDQHRASQYECHLTRR